MHSHARTRTHTVTRPFYIPAPLSPVWIPTAFRLPPEINTYLFQMIIRQTLRSSCLVVISLNLLYFCYLKWFPHYHSTYVRCRIEELILSGLELNSAPSEFTTLTKKSCVFSLLITGIDFRYTLDVQLQICQKLQSQPSRAGQRERRSNKNGGNFDRNRMVAFFV